MDRNFYFVGAYKGKPVYYSKMHGLALVERMDSLKEPEGIEKVVILSKFGGVVGIETKIENFKNMAKNYKKNG